MPDYYAKGPLTLQEYEQKNENPFKNEIEEGKAVEQKGAR